MGKRIVITTTRPDPSVPWYTDVALSTPEADAVSAEQNFLMQNYSKINFSHTSTDTTYTVTLDFAENGLFDEYANLIVNNLESPYKEYCAANDMTVTREILDI